MARAGQGWKENTREKNLNVKAGKWVLFHFAYLCFMILLAERGKLKNLKWGGRVNRLVSTRGCLWGSLGSSGFKVEGVIPELSPPQYKD